MANLKVARGIVVTKSAAWRLAVTRRSALHASTILCYQPCLYKYGRQCPINAIRESIDAAVGGATGTSVQSAAGP
jgi:hypothetical protein